MPTIRPFRCVRPAEDKASSIAALPYDVYNRAEARQVVGQNPLSFLKIDRAETQFPDDTDMYSQQVYDRARDTLREMISDGSFLEDEDSCYYLYALTFEGRTQTGIVGCASIDDYLDGTIRRHENTKEEKELDRIRHVDTLSAQTGPIFLTYRPRPKLKQITEEAKESAPLMISHQKMVYAIRYGRSRNIQKPSRNNLLISDIFISRTAITAPRLP